MSRLFDIALVTLAIAMLTTLIWGIAWSLDDEEALVKAGKKLPGTTILPIVIHAQSCAQ